MASGQAGWSPPSSRPRMTTPASNGRRRWRRSGWRSSISSRAMARTDAACEALYRDLTAKGVDVLYDDLDERPGSKFATADLIGMPWQMMVGPKGLAEGKVEVKTPCRRQPRKPEPRGHARSAVPLVPRLGWRELPDQRPPDFLLVLDKRRGLFRGVISDRHAEVGVALLDGRRVERLPKPVGEATEDNRSGFRLARPAS